MIESYQVKLLAITNATPDSEVAKLIACAMLETDKLPYAFSINHNIGPPDNKRCPLEFDWSYKNTVGIETMDNLVAMNWLTRAALGGYVLTGAVPAKGFRGPGQKVHDRLGAPYSIVNARRRAEWAQAPKNDYDIPF